MKKIALICCGTALLFSSCGGDKEKGSDVKKLSLHPGHREGLKLEYSIAVENKSSGEKTSYLMNAVGSCDSLLDGNTEFIFKNTSISMSGILSGKEVQAEAGNTENISDTLKMVTTPVFSLLNKSFKSVYNPAFDRLNEVQVSDSGFVDSTENKIQFFLNYPGRELKPGDTWTKELIVKSGNRMNCSASYLLKQIKGDSLEIEMTGKLSGKGNSFGMEFSMSGQLKAHFWVSAGSGLPMEAEARQEFTLDMSGKKSEMVYDVKYKIR